MRKFNRRIQKPKSFDRKPKKKYTGPKDTGLTVYVREGNVDRALRTFKKKVKNANIMQDLKDREFFQTRREKRRLLKDKAIRRQKRENENNKGLGFITDDKTKKDIFLHVSALENSKLRVLREEQTISYDIKEEKDKLQAINIKKK